MSVSLADDAALNVCELSTYELLHPYGQVHVWIGPISVVFFKLLYSDRRAHIHVFCDTPVTDVYSLVKPDYWCQFDVHRIHPSALSSDLLSAVLSQGLVDLANVMTLHHECSKDSNSSSLVCLLSTLPTSSDDDGPEQVNTLSTRHFFWKASLSIELPLTAHDPIHP